MDTYIYQLKDEMGKTLHGFMEAESEQDVKVKLRSSNLYFIKAQKHDRAAIFKKNVSLDRLVIFSRRFSSLIESGVPILSAMTILWRQSDDKTIQLVVSHMHRKLEQGLKISDALRDFPNIFSPIYYSLVSVAESAGSLPLILRQICSYLEAQRETRMRMQKATLYPMIVIVFAFLVLVAMFAFVVPTFHKVLSKLNTDLPLLTNIIVGISNVVKTWQFWSIILLLGGVFYFVFCHLKSKEDFAHKMDTYKLKTPIVGDIMYMMSLSRFIHALRILIGAGLPIVRSFEVAKATTNNSYINHGIDDVQTSVKQGNTLYESIREAHIFPSMFLEMTGIGESSGRMEQMLDSLAIHFDQEVEFKQNRLLTFIEPMLIIAVGVIVIITLLAVYMPIFSIWNGLMQ